MKNFFLFCLVLVFMLGLLSASAWREDPSNCPVEYNNVNCASDGELQCGIQGSGSDAQPYCYNTSDLVTDPLDPSSDMNSTTIHDSNSGPGFLVDCEATDSSEPYCDNGGQYWCNANQTCSDDLNRTTVCNSGKFAYESNPSYCSGYCKEDHAACDDVNNTLDVPSETNSCSVVEGQTPISRDNSTYNTTGGRNPGDESSGAANAVYINGDCNAGCPGDWIDTDGNLTNGCEVEEGASCTTNGVSGTIQSDGSCVADKKNFTTGDFEEYATTDSEDAMLWFQNMDSDGDLINATNAIGESWRINNDSCIVLKDDTEICDGEDIGGGTSWNLSGNYIYNNSGNITLNETVLNDTIDARSEESSEWIGLTGINSSEFVNNSGTLGLNSSFLSENFLDSSDESSLDVNSSEYLNTSIGLIGDVNSTQFSNQNNLFRINMSWLTGLFIKKTDESGLNVNSSDKLRTAEGTIDNVSDINGSDINNDLNWINGSNVYWNSSDGKVYLSNSTENVSIGDNETYGNRLQVNGSVNVTGNITADNFVDSDGNVISGSSGNGSAVPSAVNLTQNEYKGEIQNGSLQGYAAANEICNQEYPGSEMCTESTLVRAYQNDNIGGISDGTQAWVIAGGTKYASGDKVDDCGGFTDDASGGSRLGNIWEFDSSAGGAGFATSCSAPFKLTCCSY